MSAGVRANALRWIGGVAASPPPPPPPSVGGNFRAEVLNDINYTFLPGTSGVLASEFDRQVEFKIIEAMEEKIFTAWCVWDEETLQDRAIVQQQGVFLGEVCVYIASGWFAVEPRPEQIIYARRLFPDPVETTFLGWRIVQIVSAEYMYYIGIDKLTA
jgi:hypothetical protein